MVLSVPMGVPKLRATLTQWCDIVKGYKNIPFVIIPSLHSSHTLPPPPHTPTSPLTSTTQEHERHLLSEGGSEVPEGHWGEDPSENKTN